MGTTALALVLFAGRQALGTQGSPTVDGLRPAIDELRPAEGLGDLPTHEPPRMTTSPIDGTRGRPDESRHDR